LLCRGYTVAKTARAVGVTRQTVWEWKRDPRFADALARFSAEMLQSLLPAAAHALAPRSPDLVERQRRLLELCRRPRQANTDGGESGQSGETPAFDTPPDAHRLADPT
jgi:hypothetical protein